MSNKCTLKLTLLILISFPLISAVAIEDTVLKTSNNLIQITIDGNGILTADQIGVGTNYIYIENGIYLKDYVEWDCGTKNVTAYGSYELQEIGCNVVSTGTSGGSSSSSTYTTDEKDTTQEDNEITVDLKTISLSDLKITYDNWTKGIENRIKLEVFDLNNNHTDPTNITVNIIEDLNYKKEIIKEDKKYFWKGYAIVITLLMILASVGLIYLVKEGKLMPQFNSTNEIVNNYDFNPSISSPVTSNVDNDYNNTVEINFDLSDEFIERVCGNSS